MPSPCEILIPLYRLGLPLVNMLPVVSVSLQHYCVATQCRWSRQLLNLLVYTVVNSNNYIVTVYNIRRNVNALFACMCTSVCLLVDTGESRGRGIRPCPHRGKRGLPPSVSGGDPLNLPLFAVCGTEKKLMGTQLGQRQPHPSPRLLLAVPGRKNVVGYRVGATHTTPPLPPLFALPGTKTNLWGTELGLRLPPSSRGTYRQ